MPKTRHASCDVVNFVTLESVNGGIFPFSLISRLMGFGHHAYIAAG
jgi:hypothetical protein